MVVKKFEELIAWQKSQDLAIVIYSNFENIKDFSFKNQICSAVISISNNIAEGFDRSSDSDFTRFLYIALASTSEVRSMLYLSERLNYLSLQTRDILIDLTNEVSKIIRVLIKSLNR